MDISQRTAIRNFYLFVIKIVLLSGKNKTAGAVRKDATCKT